MNARALLVRGLLAGLLAGIVTFLVAYQVGEPHVEAAIAVEESGASGGAPVAEEPHTHGGDAPAEQGSDDEQGDTSVSRGDQRTWGLLSGTLAVSVALGGLVALVTAGTLGRIGTLRPGQSTALIALIGFVSVALVPFLKYPATPPAVGHGSTIGDRTALYFGFTLVSLLAAVVATYAASRLRDRIGTYGSVVAGIAGYLTVVLVAGQVFATVDEVGDFPADTLWFFRRSSLFTLATMWGVIGVVLTGLVSRLHDQQRAAAERREWAATL